MRFGLRWYWRRRPSRGEMPPPSNRTGFRPDAATTARGARFSRQSNRSRGLRDWSARRAILIGTLSRAYHVVLQRNNGIEVGAKPRRSSDRQEPFDRNRLRLGVFQDAVLAVTAADADAMRTQGRSGVSLHASPTELAVATRSPSPGNTWQRSQRERGYLPSCARIPCATPLSARFCCIQGISAHRRGSNAASGSRL